MLKQFSSVQFINLFCRTIYIKCLKIKEEKNDGEEGHKEARRLMNYWLPQIRI